MKKAIVGFFEEHQTVASILTIIIAIATINNWMTRDIREDTKQTNKRIDSLFQYVLTKQVIEEKK